MSPACARAGANKSCRVRHQSTRPRSRAAIPAAKRAAAAPSIAPWPPPTTSCSAPSANPPPGRCQSIALRPKGSTNRRGPAAPSRRRIRSRISSIPERVMGALMSLATGSEDAMFHICSQYAERVNRSLYGERKRGRLNLEAFLPLPQQLPHLRPRSHCCALQKNCPAKERSGDAAGNSNPTATAGELRTRRERWFHGSPASTLIRPMSVAYLEKLNPEQRRAVEHGVRENDAAPGAPLLVLAGAGACKNHTLAH